MSRQHECPGITGMATCTACSPPWRMDCSEPFRPDSHQWHDDSLIPLHDEIGKLFVTRPGIAQVRSPPDFSDGGRPVAVAKRQKSLRDPAQERLHFLKFDDPVSLPAAEVDPDVPCIIVRHHEGFGSIPLDAAQFKPRGEFQSQPIRNHLSDPRSNTRGYGCADLPEGTGWSFIVASPVRIPFAQHRIEHGRQ